MVAAQRPALHLPPAEGVTDRTEQRSAKSAAFRRLAGGQVRALVGPHYILRWLFARHSPSVLASPAMAGYYSWYAAEFTRLAGQRSRYARVFTRLSRVLTRYARVLTQSTWCHTGYARVLTRLSQRRTRYARVLTQLAWCHTRYTVASFPAFWTLYGFAPSVAQR
jgi:hypothetical protein